MLQLGHCHKVKFQTHNVTDTADQFTESVGVHYSQVPSKHTTA